MNVNDPAHLTEELLERLLASDDIETQQLLRLAGVSELYCRQRRSGGGTTTIMDERQTMHAMMLDDAYCVERVLADGAYGVTRNGEPRWSRAVRAQEDAAAAGEAAYELPDMFVVVYDYVDGVTIDHYVGERDDDNGDGVYGSDVAISLILRGEKGNCVFWRSEYVRKPAKGESRASSIQIYGLPKYASYEAYAYAS